MLAVQPWLSVIITAELNPPLWHGIPIPGVFIVRSGCSNETSPTSCGVARTSDFRCWLNYSWYRVFYVAGTRCELATPWSLLDISSKNPQL